MVIDIQRISERGLHLSGAMDIDRQDLIEDSAFLNEEIRYDITFVRERNKIRATGTLRTSVTLACVRCLEEYEIPLDSHYDLVLFPASELTGVDNAVKSDETEYIFYEGSKIDLSKILSEQVNLSLPFNPVCRDECRGLCSHCGANLNQRACQCGQSGSEISLLFEKIKR